MNKFLIITLVFVAYKLVSADDNLQPAPSVFGESNTNFNTAKIARSVLFKGQTDQPVIRELAFSIRGVPDMLSIIQKSDGLYYVIYQEPTDINEEKLTETTKYKTSEAKIDAGLVDKIHDIWIAGIRSAKYPATDNSLTDVSPCYYMTFEKNFGNLCAIGIIGSKPNSLASLMGNITANLIMFDVNQNDPRAGTFIDQIKKAISNYETVAHKNEPTGQP